MKRVLHLAIFAISMQLCSCSKNDTEPPKPNGPSPSNVIDESKLKSKWELTSYYTLVFDKASGNVRDASGVSQTYHDHGVGQWDASFTSYMTFNNDYSFDHSNKDGSAASPILDMYLPRHGQWQLKNANKSISFEIKPVMGQTTITYDVVEFKDNYIHLTYKDTTTWSDAYDVNHLEFKK
ncbi:MAG: hypothetical protein BGO69_10825 [Bacteroidetes bacterium 46-16]|nr:MAG: hypothetical protein BGO69_10825 [Bacteroidetes bacterium 46-16]